MTSNYNVILLPITADGKYRVGDIFELKGFAICNLRLARFHGLEIKNIDYCFGVRLHFDWQEWEGNAPIVITSGRETKKGVIKRKYYV
jgi:hypothetical protein